MTTHAQPAPAGFRGNLVALRSAQKPARGTAAYSRYVNRPLGRILAAAAKEVGLTPNRVTAISALLSAAALLVLATQDPNWRIGLTVSVLLAAGYAMDSADGQLARLCEISSKSGEWLDHTVDCFKTVLLHTAVLISWYQFTPIDNKAILLVPLAFQAIDVVTFFGFMFLPMVRPANAVPVRHPAESRLRPWLLLPSDYGLMLWLFVLLASPILFCAAYSAVFAINAMFLALALRKWWRELKSIDAANWAKGG